MSSTKKELHQKLKTIPRPFQIKGIRFLRRRNGRGIIGDDMGLGKTYQTIGYLRLQPETQPAVIVCPAFLKINWQRELWRHGRLLSDIAETNKPYELKHKIWIINYDILNSWLDYFLSKNVKTLTIDECQKVKNQNTKRAKACKILSQSCNHVIGLSGTPIENGPVEFFSILNMVDPKEFASFPKYAFRYCAPKPAFQGRGWDFSGASHLDELKERISPYIIRRTKSEVLTELPPKTRTIIPIRINRKEYNRARDEFIQYLSERKGLDAAKRARSAQALVQMGELKRLAALGKMDAIKEWISDFLAASERPKLVLFAVHTQIITELKKAFPNSVVITGKVKMTERQNAVDTFQNDTKCPLLFANMLAGGVGLNLTASATVGFVELGWVPAHHEQAEDRICRIGQTALRIDAFYFIAEDTIEEKIMRLLDSKRDVVGKVIDSDKNITQQNVMSTIISEFLKEKGEK